MSPQPINGRKYRVYVYSCDTPPPSLVTPSSWDKRMRRNPSKRGSRRAVMLWVLALASIASAYLCNPT